MTAFELIQKLQEEIAEKCKDMKSLSLVEIDELLIQNKYLKHMIELLDEDIDVVYGHGIGEIAQKQTSTKFDSEEDKKPF